MGQQQSTESETQHAAAPAAAASSHAAPTTSEVPAAGSVAKAVANAEKFGTTSKAPSAGGGTVSKGHAPASNKVNFNDSNIANFGTALEHKVKLSAAETEKAWKGTGQKVGLEIWRIENFHVVPWPAKLYGTFYTGDCYIVLRTYKPTPDAKTLRHDIHFWIGDESTQDEYGTAAYKTVELDDHLGGEPTQHREVHGSESAQFLGYFKTVHFLKGGVESGFHHVKPEEYKVLGDHNVVVRQVELSNKSLNSSDVFILDNGLTLYQLNGTGSTGLERVKAAELSHAIHDDRGGRAQILVFSEDDRDRNLEPFWQLVGGRTPLKPAPREPDQARNAEKHLYCVSDRTGKLTMKEVKPVAKSSLKSDDVFVLDAGYHIFVWIGKKADANERKNGMTFATNYLFAHNRPKTLPITRLLEGGDNEPFYAALSPSS